MKIISTNNSGFSITELIIVLFIIGVIAGLSYPSFKRQQDNATLNSGNRILSSWIDDQRRKAIQNSSPCDITINSSAVSASSQCDFENTTGSTINLVSEVDRGDELNISLTQGNATWTFSPRGTTRSTVELRIGLNDSEVNEKCLLVREPLGLIQTGRLTTGGVCNFNTRY